MSLEVMKQALEALEKFAKGESSGIPVTTLTNTLRQAIEQAERQQALDKKAENARELGLDYEPVQEPKKWVDVECPLCGEMAVAHTHPSLKKREWIGLTDEEIVEIWPGIILPARAAAITRAIEAKLKQKNGGNT